MELSARLRKELRSFRLEAELDCPAGEILAVVGPSGAGKSTLLRLLAGLLRPDAGRVALGPGVLLDTAGRIDVPPHRRGLGLLFQDCRLFPHLTLARNVAYAAAPGQDPAAWLERLGIAHLAGRRPHQVSGGERQRAALGQALARQPRALLLDEPFSSLDLETRLGLRRDFADLVRRAHIPVVHVTHDLGEALALADRILALERGRPSPGWLARQLDLFAAECREAGQRLSAPHPGKVRSAAPLTPQGALPCADSPASSS
mgnify:CR=1 FL=1